MIRISGPLNFGLDGQKRLGSVHVGQRRLSGYRHFDDHFGIIANQVTRADIPLDRHQVMV